MKAKMKLTRLWSFLLTLVMVVGLLPTVAYAETSTVYITKIEINDFNPEFHTGMTGDAATDSLTFSYPDDANYSKGNDNRYIKQNGSFIYDNNLTAGAATLMISVYANPFGNNVENPAYDFDEANLNSIEVWINGEKRTDVEVKGYNSAWRKVDIYIPVTVSEYTGLTHTVTFDSNGGTAVESQQVVNSGYASEPSEPTKDGKVFIGWYTDPGLTTKFNFSSTPITSDITLYAKWEDKVVTQYITKIEINNFNPKFHTGMTGDAATDSLTFSYPDDANYSKGNDNRYIKQNGSFIYDNNLTAGAATLMISVYANPFGNNVENPAYDFDEANLNSIEVWINGEKRTDVEVKGYNSAWRKVDIYIPVTVSEYTSLNHTVSFAANGGTGTMADVTGVSGDYVLPVCDFTAPNGKQFKAWSVGGVEKAAGDKITVTANTTVTAIWEAVEYNVTVTGGTASVSAGTPITKATMGTTVTLTANAASDGMIFDKWVVEDGSASITLADANSATTTFTMPAGEVSVKATYRSYITINLAAGEGSGTMEPLILKATYGYYELIAPDCTFTPPANKVFDKWQFSKDDSYLKPGDTKTIWSSANGATLTAIWKDAPVTYYTVSFDSNGGTGSMADVTGISGEYTLPANGFTAPAGKQFKAWSVGGVEKAAGDTITVNANTTVTAVWEAVEYNVTVTGGTASVGAGTPITKATMGTTVTLTAGAAPTGQMFDKWVVNGVVVDDANSATTTFVMPAGNVTAEATYKNIPVVTYTVSFDANGGTDSMADATGVSGDYVLPVCGFTAPNGKQFKGWSVGGVEKAAGDTITVNANTTVTAIWENIPVTYYTVTFDSNGGSAVTAQSIEAGQKATKPADPTKDGYDFKGWTLNGSAYDFNTAVNGNITLVATWEQQQVVPTTYTVSFDANGGTGTMADVTGISGEYTLPENGFTAPDGKQFKAWSVDGNEKAVGDKITVTADTTVTAVWEDIPAGHTCDIKPVAKVEPSCTEAGKEAYYKCEGCGKFYEDALGTKEITDLAAWGNLAKLGHTESDWKSDKDNHWKECTVAGCGVIIENSKAAHADANNDGKCDTCEYNVGKTPTNPGGDKPNDNPQTGDNSMMWLWVALLFVSGFGVVTTTVYTKKRKSVK